MGYTTKEIISDAVASGASVLGLVGDIVSQTGSRHSLPDFYQESAGSFGFPWLIVVGSNLLGEACIYNGTKNNNKKMVNTGHQLKGIGLGLAIGLAFMVEAQFINRPELWQENAPDMIVGLIAITIAAKVNKMINKSLFPNNS
jgi:hypothetical protein